jgi:DNA topoisomerase-1
MGHVDYLRTFYFGNDHPGLKEQLKNKVDEIDAREVCQVSLGRPPGGGQQIVVRVGRYGPFLQQGERRASLPETMPPDELSVEKAVELLDKAQKGDEPLGACPETGKPVYVKVGRFGPYVQRGDPDGDEKPQNASLLKGMPPEDVDLQTALELLSLPRTVGTHPESGVPVLAHNGRYGPYVQCGDETRSLPDDVSPLDVTLGQALTALSQPKGGRRRAATRAKEPLKTFEASPVTGQVVKLLDGRYGPYVTDGQTNASLPRGVTPGDVSFEAALDLLKIRAEKGPSRRAARRKTAAPKKTAPKKKTGKKRAKKP